MITIEERFNTIFPLAGNDPKFCRLDDYQSERELLYLSVSHNVLHDGEQKSERLCRLVFSGVLYLSCPTHWQCANFELGSSTKCVDLLVFAGYPEAIAQQIVVEKRIAHLFEIIQPRNFVQIIASGIEAIETKHDES